MTMLVKLQFRQQVGARDAQKGAGAKGQHRSQHGCVRVHELPGTDKEQQRAHRCHQGESAIHHKLSSPRGTTGRHECGDGHCAKWLVQDHRQRRAERQCAAVASFRRGHRRRQCHAVKNRVQREAQGDADPVQFPRRPFRQRMGVPARFHRAAFSDIVMMKRKKALQKKHHEKSAQQPRRPKLNGIELVARVRQQAQQRQSQHQPRDKTHGDLQPSVRQLEQAWQHSAQAQFIGGADGGRRRGLRGSGAHRGDGRVGDHVFHRRNKDDGKAWV